MKVHTLLPIFLLASILCNQQVHARSIHRPKDTTIPTLYAKWSTDIKWSHKLQDTHLQAYPFFEVFDKDFFYQHMLPKDSITYRYDQSKKVAPDTLKKLIATLIIEINEQKKIFTNFSVLSEKNFSRKKKVGMIVLKFKNYPFILKLCIETPESFVWPYGKGIDNVWFFPMGGGVNRHITGLTRIKNLHLIKKKLQEGPWADKVDVPRKWHWIPDNHPWLELKGENMPSSSGTIDQITTKIPSLYGIIADEIDAQKKLNLFDRDYTKITMNLCNYLEHWIDCHIDNFMIERNSKKIVIVDTEHFPTVVGIKDPVQFENYSHWFTFLTGKCIKDWFFQSKYDRLAPKPNLMSLNKALN